MGEPLGFQNDNNTITRIHEKSSGRPCPTYYKFQILRNALKTLQPSMEDRNYIKELDQENN